MAGVTIKVTSDDRDVRRAMAALGRAGGERLIQAALKNIGQALVRSTRQRFSQEVSPDGKPWEKLNPEYAKGKRGGKILQEQGMRGGLLGTIVWQLKGGSAVEIGTNKVYAAVHQFGATIRPRSAQFLSFMLGGRRVFARKVTIPARPFLGLGRDDPATILEIVRDHVTQAWRKG